MLVDLAEHSVVPHTDEMIDICREDVSRGVSGDEDLDCFKRLGSRYVVNENARDVNPGVSLAIHYCTTNRDGHVVLLRGIWRGACRLALFLNLNPSPAFTRRERRGGDHHDRPGPAKGKRLLENEAMLVGDGAR